MTIFHTSHFSFKASAGAQKVQEVCDHMLDLKNQCIDPSTQKPYIKSLTGGINNSPEGRNNGYHYGYVVEFASAEDRDYYLNEDPATQAFFKVATPVIQKFQTLDYEAGVFR